MRRKDMGTNPYRRARARSGMSIPDVVRGAEDLSFSAVWNVEHGLVASPNPRIKAVLAAVGVDVTGLDEEYAAWRKVQSKVTIQKFAAANEARG